MRHAISISALLLVVACDPVHSNEVDALGGEAPGVRPGQLHRPGQPCLLCHDGKIGDPGEFSVAGTVFLDAYDTTPASGVNVFMTGADGTTYEARTNAAGNFYVTPRQWVPAYPMLVHIESGTTIEMKTHVGREGSCNGCHFDPAGPDSPGHVYATAPDGGAL